MIGVDRFGVVTVGFDAKVDTPDHMAAFARGQGLSRTGWLMLSADGDTVRRLSDELGFSFFPAVQGFDHLVQTTVLDGEGRVYRQIYGTDITPQALTTALGELTSGQPVEFRRNDGWLDRLQLLCSIYDPTQGRFRFDFGLLFTILIGGGSMAGIGFFLIRAWRNASPTRPV
ncbi:hypothetical protein CCP1ISM_2860001 [Azospirillaceae bacterium]